jgi:transposase-like protein
MSNPAPPPISAPNPTKVRTRVNWTPVERAQWLSLFEKSGQSVSEFCRANDLPSATLSLWRQQQTAAGSAAEGGALVEIATSSIMSTSSKPFVILRLPGDIAIEVLAETDPKWLGTVANHLANGRT